MKKILKKNQVIISVIAIMLIAAGYMNYTTNVKATLDTAAFADSEKYGDLGDATLVSSSNVNETTADETNGNQGKDETKESTQQNENRENVNEQNQNEQKEEVNSSNYSKENLPQNLKKNTNEQKENNAKSGENISENTVQTSGNTSNNNAGNQYFTESKLERDKMYSQMLESYQTILQNTTIPDSQKEISQNEIKKINATKNAIMITENLIKNKGFEDVIIFVNGESINVIIKALDLNQEQVAQIQNIVAREMKTEIENIHISKK